MLTIQQIFSLILLLQAFGVGTTTIAAVQNVLIPSSTPQTSEILASTTPITQTHQTHWTPPIQVVAPITTGAVVTPTTTPVINPVTGQPQQPVNAPLLPLRCSLTAIGNYGTVVLSWNINTFATATVEQITNDGNGNTTVQNTYTLSGSQGSIQIQQPSQFADYVMNEYANTAGYQTFNDNCETNDVNYSAQ